MQRSDRVTGQTLVELTLIMPLFIMLLLGIVVLGVGVFYQQQVANAAREAARFASVHSATSDCPTTSSVDPDLSMVAVGFSVDFCDPHESNWPKLTAHAKGHIFGIPKPDVHLSACWSGYVSDTGQPDAPPPGIYTDNTDPLAPVVTEVNSTWEPCLIDGADPSSDLGSIDCAAGLARTDTASNLSDSDVANVANRVTVYMCYSWQPPLAGFLLIPQEIVIRAASTEAIERQQ